MTGAVEKNYSQALFDAILEEKEDLEQAQSQLDSVSGIVKSCEGFEKLMDSPTVSNEENWALSRTLSEESFPAASTTSFALSPREKGGNTLRRYARYFPKCAMKNWALRRSP